jgi:hypothetical protein
MREMGQFFKDLKTEGIWYAMTGQNFLEWLQGAFHALINYSDVLIIVAMVLGLFTMGGSKTAGKYMYWTFFVYLILKMVGWYF